MPQLIQSKLFHSQFFQTFRNPCVCLMWQYTFCTILIPSVYSFSHLESVNKFQDLLHTHWQNSPIDIDKWKTQIPHWLILSFSIKHRVQRTCKYPTDWLTVHTHPYKLVVFVAVINFFTPSLPKCKSHTNEQTN